MLVLMTAAAVLLMSVLMVMTAAAMLLMSVLVLMTAFAMLLVLGFMKVAMAHSAQLLTTIEQLFICSN